MTTSPFEVRRACLQPRRMSRLARCLLALGLATMTGCAPKESTVEKAAEPSAPLAANDARRFTKLMRGSISPDRRLAIAVGTADRTRPEWRRVEPNDGSEPSFLIADSFNTANYLVSLSAHRVLATLDSNHSGTAAGYNHELAAFHWSLDSRWLVEEHHWKWHTAQCTVHRIGPDGQSLARLDLKPMASKVIARQLLQTVRGAKPGDIKNYSMRIEVIKITNDGFITARVTAGTSKEDSADLEVQVRAKLKQTARGQLAVEEVSP